MTDTQTRRPSRALRIRIIIYGGLLVALLTLLPRWVHTMTYPIPENEAPSPPPSPIFEVALVNGQGQNLSAWFLPCSNPDAPIVLFFHGNGQDLGNMLYSGFVHRFQAMGAHLFAIDYPGYGNSQGKPSEASLIESGELAMEWALTNYPSSRKVLMGWSVGAAVAIQVGASFSGHYDGLILVSPWTSIKEIARAHYPAWVVALLMNESYDSLALANKINTPSIVIHGKDDTLIPVAMGKQLAEVLGKQSPCELMIISGRGHENIFDTPLVWTHLDQFLNKSTGSL